VSHVGLAFRVGAFITRSAILRCRCVH